MLDRDSLILGILLGLVVPFVGYAVLLMLTEQINSAQWLSPEIRGFSFRTRTLAVFAICLNIIPFRMYQKWWHQTTMRGIIITTFLYIGVWLYMFAGQLF